MSAIQSKITRYTKKQKNMNYDKGKNQSLETDPGLTQDIRKLL